MKNTKIALVQMFSKVGEKNYNINKIEKYVKETSENNVHIICFPELSVCGYNVEKADNISNDLSSDIFKKISDIAVDNKITVLAGIRERDENSKNLYITQLVCYPDGRIDKYRKIHVGQREKEIFSQGNEINIFENNYAKFGIQICYDAHFPEVSTIQSIKGAEIIFMPHASPIGGMKRKNTWLKYLSARAYDNSVYIAVCNHIYENKQGDFSGGGSIIIDPKGDVIAEDFSSDEGILYAELNSKLINNIRCEKSNSMKNNFFIKDRRGEIYKEYL